MSSRVTGALRTLRFELPVSERILERSVLLTRLRSSWSRGRPKPSAPCPPVTRKPSAGLGKRTRGGRPVPVRSITPPPVCTGREVFEEGLLVLALQMSDEPRFVPPVVGRVAVGSGRRVVVLGVVVEVRLGVREGMGLVRTVGVGVGLEICVRVGVGREVVERLEEGREAERLDRLEEPRLLPVLARDPLLLEDLAELPDERRWAEASSARRKPKSRQVSRGRRRRIILDSPGILRGPRTLSQQGCRP